MLVYLETVTSKIQYRMLVPIDRSSLLFYYEEYV